MSNATQTGPDDLIRPFQIDPFALRGRLVRLGPVLDQVVSQHGYPEPVVDHGEERAEALRRYQEARR